MNHEQSPVSSPEVGSVATIELSPEDQASLARFLSSENLTVRRRDSEEQKPFTDNGWKLTGRIDHVGEDGVWVELIKPGENGELAMVAALKGLEHYNPAEPTPETSEVERRQEDTKELGHKAVAHTVEVEEVIEPATTELVAEPDEIIYEKEHLDAIKKALTYDMHTMNGIVQQGDIQYLAQYLTTVSQKIAELRAIDAGSEVATTLDNILAMVRSQVSVDMNNNSFSRHLYEQYLSDIAATLNRL